MAGSAGGRPGRQGTPAPAGQVMASVLLVNHNGRRHLERCLTSLVSQGTTDVEILLLDNGSTDGSAGYVVEAFPQVRLIRSEANLGFGAGNNLLARLARGEYLAFLNPDTVVKPGWLAALAGALQADPQAGLATAKILLLDEPDRINTCGNEVHLSGLTLCRGMGAPAGAYGEPARVGAVSGAAFVMRRDLFDALGGFDESFFLYMEDTDLSLRARLAGWRCLCVPGSVVLHAYRLRFGPDKVFYQERNRYLMMLKLFRWPTLVALMGALLLAEAVTWGFVIARERGQAAGKLRAYRWIAHNWRQVMDGRRRTQALRRVRDRDLLALADYRLAFEQTGQGLSARLARLVFDPLFWLLRLWARAVVWW